MPAYPINAARCRDLVQKLEASNKRIQDYRTRLDAGIRTLKPIEFDRLADEYHNEMQRNSRICQELEAIEEPRKTKEYVERRRMYQQRKKSKVKY